MAALTEPLSRWALTEMELPASSLPSESSLRRLCSGPSIDIWDFVTRHIRHPRTVQKIRGNLAWDRHLEQMKGVGFRPRNRDLQEELEGLRGQLGALEGLLGGTQEAALELKTVLEERRSWLGRGLRRTLELRLLAEAAVREERSLKEGRGFLHPPTRSVQTGAELSAMVAAGLEPEVLNSVRAACAIRAAALEELLEPRPPHEMQKPMEAANERWLRTAKGVLSTYPPLTVLWALEHLANESTRLPLPRENPDLDPEAPPTVRSLIQECWGAVGGLWGHLPPLVSRLRLLQSRLLQLQQLLGEHLGGDPETQQAARLALELAALLGSREALTQGVLELKGGPKKQGGNPKLGESPPNPKLGERREQLRRERIRLHRRQHRLRALGEATQSLKGNLRPLAAKVREAGLAQVVRALAALEEEGRRLHLALGTLGAQRTLGEVAPGPGPSPLLPTCRALGLPAYQPPEAALVLAVALRREVRRGAWPRRPPLPPPLPPISDPVGVARAESRLLPQLHTLAEQCRQRLGAWPRLQQLIDQWWEQPAQWVLAPPPGRQPFSYWLQRWNRAAKVLALPPALAPPPQEAKRRGQNKPRP